MIRPIAASVAVLALAACGQPAGKAPAAPPAAAPAPAAPGPPAPAADTVTSKGLGPLRIGMTEAQVRQAVGGDIVGDTGDMAEGCMEMELKGAWPGVHLMLEEGKLTRISIGEGSPVKTDKGVGVGDAPAEVSAAYPDVKTEPHKYEGPPAAYMLHWDVPNQEGIEFEINGKGVVGAIHAGGPSIQYVEGCA